ncbi:MAG TPA: hypothetical protein VNH45_00360 [Gaiellaceae bacterium]|nr:hypothetical protein [Gaiellaceae bacterium]
MDAGQVAGLLVLLGVVGVLAAIVGSGIEAGPVKFPSIPGSRQKPLAVASVLVVAGGISWWVVQQTTGGRNATTTTPPPTKKLTISLIPSSNDVRVGDDLKIAAEVSNSNGQQLGTGQCELDWRDSKTTWAPVTTCEGPGIERSITKAGVHDITVTARGLGGLRAYGSSRPLRVNVTS